MLVVVVEVEVVVVVVVVVVVLELLGFSRLLRVSGSSGEPGG